MHISEPLVVETCHKLVLASAQGQYVRLEGVSLLVASVIYIYVRLVQTAVLAKSFSVAHLYHCAFRSLQAETGNTCHIIPKIIEVGTIGQLRELHSRILAASTDGAHLLRGNLWRR